MIIQRIWVPYKPGKRAEAIEALRTCARSLYEAGVFRSMPRIYTHTDNENTTTGDFEFEDMADMTARWARADQHPAMQAFAAVFNPLVDTDDPSKVQDAMKHEFLTIVEM